MDQSRANIYWRAMCLDYWCTTPFVGFSKQEYLDCRRSYEALKKAYLDLRPYYLNELGNKDFVWFERDFLNVKKDFLAHKEEYRRSFEKDFESMREVFLGSKRDEYMRSPASLRADSFIHDMFLSFRGKDVRETLVDDLSQSLSKAGFRVFLDSNNLKKGAKIWPSLKSAIGKSAICIPIFSEGYADSAWCLKESAEMLKTPHLIIPLFYGVDPSDVRYPLKKKSPYKRSFEKHYAHPDRHSEEEIDGWKNGLREICSRSGWTMSITQDFHVGVEGIVRDVIDIFRSSDKEISA